ncbi:MAG: c-type cytochrome [Myxococcota bacterium]
MPRAPHIIPRAPLALLRVMLIAVFIGAAGCDEDIVTPPRCPEGVDYSDAQVLFEAQCAPCHGADGLGGSSYGILHELHHTDSQLIQVMLDGKGSMPAVNITEAEAASIVDYMRCVL